jgi:hypothetical protein
MSDIRLGDVFFIAESDRGCAYWRATGDTTNVFLAAISLDAYNGDPQLQNQFLQLASAVAAHKQRAVIAGTSKPASRLAGLPCETCETPQGVDVRHRAMQVTDINELGLSPSGLPMNCCRVHTVGVMMLDAPSSRPPAPARRMGRRY